MRKTLYKTKCKRNTILSKVYQIGWHRKVLYHGLLWNYKCLFCLYSWARGGFLPFHTSSTSLSFRFLRERWRTTIEPGPLAVGRSIRNKTWALLTLLWPDSLEASISRSCGLTSSDGPSLPLSHDPQPSPPCQKQQNSKALKLKAAFSGFIS